MPKPFTTDQFGNLAEVYNRIQADDAQRLRVNRRVAKIVGRLKGWRRIRRTPKPLPGQTEIV